ncbi:hypothetical protein [Rudanella lutea]|jgi:hypothetical protein|uniref:hypothetical protein n=1 Tax=Rudanella lutea TaxID=451374 RepID=UPI00037A26BA|nr:hypothetical protein [Rudanella lutea]
MKKLVLLLLIGLVACDEDSVCEKEPDQTTGLIHKRFPDGYLAYDTRQGEDLGRFGIRISTADEYKRVFTHCCATRLDSVDFSQYDVLGLSTVNVGTYTGSYYVYDVQRDDVDKRIVYTVTERYCKRGSPVDGRGNFVLIPKVPAGYRVEYVRQQVKR